jgi:hypothetical protein
MSAIERSQVFLFLIKISFSLSTDIAYNESTEITVSHFPHQQHKACCASPLSVSCATCFEALARVFASAGALQTFQPTTSFFSIPQH